MITEKTLLARYESYCATLILFNRRVDKTKYEVCEIRDSRQKDAVIVCVIMHERTKDERMANERSKNLAT